MITLDLTPPPREDRAADTDRTYTTDRVGALMASYASGPGAVATAVAAVEIAAGLWSRALALATVTPQNARTRAITPAILELAGRSLARRGQVVFDLEVDAGGALALIPCAAATVLLGSPDPASWIYSLQCYGPSSTVTRYRPRDGVVHLQYGREATRPWQGRAPWQTAHLSGALLAGLEGQLSGEASSSSGYVVPMPDSGDHGQGVDSDGEDDPFLTLRRDMAGAQGKTLLVPSLAGGLGAGPGVSPTTSQEYMPRRWGADPPEALIELRRDVERSVLSCYGILPSLFYERAAGTALREAGRQTHANSAVPIAQLVAAQLSEALDESITLTLPRATDVATLSRAIGSLVTAGVEVGEARAIVGI